MDGAQDIPVMEKEKFTNEDVSCHTITDFINEVCHNEAVQSIKI